MKQKYIGLTIKDKNGNEIDFKDLVSKNQISIILGNPGSGKTTLLKNYKSTIGQKYARFLTIKELLKLRPEIYENDKILLLDGIDEYRVASQDKTFVASELAYTIDKIIEKYPDIKIVLTCREMDWFGEDHDRLEEYVRQKVEIFYLQPLNLIQQVELAKILIEQDFDKFLEKFQNNDLLENPQLFYMLSIIWQKKQKKLNTKMDVYRTFIEVARSEHNREHNGAQQQIIDEKQALKLLGYLSYFYFFCGIETFAPEILKDISSIEDGYPYALLNQITHTKLFSKNGGFFHKTIAEFALAYHLVNNFRLKNTVLYFEKIKALFTSGEAKIPARLRGAYAWLCSLSENINFIKVDPYYQAIYGDNSLFDTKRKTFVLQAVREYSQKNPYFINFSQHVDLGGFYSKDLDRSLMVEYNKAVKLDNHYIYFLNYIITQGIDVSEDMQNFIKDKIKSKLPCHYKRRLLKFFGLKEDVVFLKEVLNSIVDKKIDDEENSLKDLVLDFLYPKHITSQEVIKYLYSYKETDTLYWHYQYLFKTPFDEKEGLVCKILGNRNKIKNKKHSLLPYSIHDFIKDFFFEIYIKLDDIQKIYACLKYFHDNFFQYNNMEIAPFTKQNKEIEKSHQQILQECSNTLFEERVREQVIKNDVFMYDIYNFPYYCSPTNKADVFFSMLNKINNGELLDNIKEREKKDTKKNLLFAWIKSLPEDEMNEEYCAQIVRENNLDKEYGEYKEYFFKEEQRYAERRRWEQEQQEKIKIDLGKNEDFFKEKDTKELVNNFNAMNWIAELYLYRQNDIGKYITLETFEKKLKVTLKEILYIYPHPFSNAELTIDELSKQPQNSIRNIDSVYYASICANDGALDFKRLEENFKSYLYIVALWHEHMHSIQSTDFCTVLEKNDEDFVLATLKKYITLLANRCFKNKAISATTLRYIKSEPNIQNIKFFARLHENDSNLPIGFMRQFLHHFGFFLTLEELEVLNNECVGHANRKTIQALLNLDNHNSADIETALSIFSLLDAFPGSEKRFSILDDSIKIKILTYLMNAFNAKELLQEKRSTSAMSTKDLCIWFLKYDVLKNLSKQVLARLLEDFQDTIWEYPILHEISNQEAKECNAKTYEIDDIKKLITQDFIINEEMFFEEIYLQLKEFGQKIEKNEHNGKKVYYNIVYDNNKNEKWSSRSEKDIQDIVFSFLKNQQKKDTLWVREKAQTNNFADINAQYKKNPSFQVQIECKKDSHRDVIKGVKKLLIDKYLTKQLSFGIYIVFYFGEKNRSKDKILELLNNEIMGYKERVKILIIDLQYKIKLS